MASRELALSPWPHRLAVVLVCATFPLVWVGGLVTTYEAGMAVPDWPNTFGYNLFLYPWQTWLFGPWDLFIEHGHRLLGAMVGMLTIGLVATAFFSDPRPWLRYATLAALLLVIAQGTLGGLRVLWDARLLAQVHGAVGPAFFALATALAVFTSRRWMLGSEDAAEPSSPRATFKFQRLALVTTLLAYAQIVVGTQVRHVRADVDATAFRAAVWLHLGLALVLTVHILWLAARALLSFQREAWLWRPSLLLAVLVEAQLLLGCGAWVVNYGWPAGWFDDYAWAQRFVIAHESQRQALITTAHVAAGSLILATAVVISLRALLLPGGAIERLVPRLPAREVPA